MKKITFILFFIFISYFTYSQNQNSYDIEENGYFTNLQKCSKGILLTDNYASKIYLLENGQLSTIIASQNCGRYYTVSPEGNFIGYKIFTEQGKQIPASYNIKTAQITELYTKSKLCGQPSFSNNGIIAFSINNTIKILSSQTQKTIDIGTYCNITPISPNGKYIVFDKNQKTLHILNIETEQIINIPVPETGCIYPKWSPDSKKIVFTNKNMELFVYDLPKKQLYKIGTGTSPSWSEDSEFIVFQQNYNALKNLKFIGSDIFITKFDGTNRKQLTSTKNTHEMSPIFVNEKIIYHTYNKLSVLSADFNSKNLQISNNTKLYKSKKKLDINFYSTDNQTKNKAIVMVPGDVPYVHQVYDTPTDRNGYSACAPTTSIMALAYFNRVPPWSIEINKPPVAVHTNNYGGYILDRYRLNEFYLNSYSSSKNAYGGYAYMWVSPYSSPGSGGMQAYQELHLLNSGNYVWTSNCYYSNTTGEIDAGFPHPICSWLTASGHLTLAVGYVVGQHTIIFNDPYGDKNSAGYPSYDGKDSYYDWPGYNNGFQNLDATGTHGTVAWTLTARTSEPNYDNLSIDDIYYKHGFSLNNSELTAHQRYYRGVYTSAAHEGHLWWTGGVGDGSNDICYATWQPQIENTMLYEVSVFIPALFTDAYDTPNPAVASEVHYQIHHQDGLTRVIIDQTANQNSWVSLGTYTFVPEVSYVYLGDSTSAANHNTKILYDAVKWEVACSPLSGVKTISSSGGDFENFTEAINMLNTCGVAPEGVTFNVPAGEIFTENPPEILTSGIETGQIIFQKSGAGDNPIIKPSGTGNIDDFGICINGCNYITFDGIDIEIETGNNLEYGYFIKNLSSTEGAQNNIIKNCNITLNNTNENSIGIYQYIDIAINPSSSNGANSFNTYENINIENSYQGILLAGFDVSGQEPLYDDNCNILDCNINNFGGSSPRAVGILTWSQKNLIIENNSISNGISQNYSSGTEGRCLGIYCAGNNTAEIYKNNISSLQGDGYQVVGIRAYDSECDFYENIVSDLTGEIMASGIEFYLGTYNIYNNFIFDIKAPDVNSSTYNFPAVRGISCRNGVVNVFYNSILLDYTSTNTNNQSAGIYLDNLTGNVDIRNNIFVNNTNVETGNLAAAIYFNLSSDFSNLSSNSNNNLYFANTPSNKNLIAYIKQSTTSYQTLNNYQTAVSPTENNSVTENPPFINSIPPYNLHINSMEESQIDGGAIVISSPFAINTDIDEEARDAAEPDIGADEYIENLLSISTESISGSPFYVSETVGCPVDVEFTTTGNFTEGNIFTAYLSDNGFVSKIEIGNVEAISGTTIEATIPAATTSGSNYRIRVEADNPTIIGTDNGEDLEIIYDNLPPVDFQVQTVISATGNIVENYWNSTNTSLEVHVPIDDDNSLINGTIQILSKINSENFENLGDVVSIPSNALGSEMIIEFTENQVENINSFDNYETLIFTAIITDLAQNETTGTQSENELFVDEIIPTVNISQAKNYSLLFNFSEEIIDFEASDLQLNNAIIDSIITSDYQQFYVYLTAVNSNYDVSIKLLESTITDLAGNPNLESDEYSFTPTIIVADIENKFFNVYPNPSKGKITISVYLQQFKNTKIKVEIIDIFGKTVFNSPLKKVTRGIYIDISELPAGIYILKIFNTEIYEQQKIIIQ